MSVCVCTWCGQSFKGKRSDSLFCNPACKQKYWRWKHHLQLDRKTIMVTIDEILKYLENPLTENEASAVLGEITDRLHAYGFKEWLAQHPFDEAVYTLSNQLGGKDE
jgi:hypothetical protein